MTTEYSPSDVFHDTITLPSDGDPRNATTLNGGFEDVADNTFWCHKRVSDSLLAGHFTFQNGTPSAADPIGLKFKTRTGSSTDVYTGISIYVQKVRQ